MGKKLVIEISIYEDVEAFGATATGTIKLSMKKKEIENLSPEKLKELANNAIEEFDKCKEWMKETDL